MATPNPDYCKGNLLVIQVLKDSRAVANLRSVYKLNGEIDDEYLLHITPAMYDDNCWKCNYNKNISHEDNQLYCINRKLLETKLKMQGTNLEQKAESIYLKRQGQ